MKSNDKIKKAQQIISSVKGKPLSTEERAKRAIELASLMLEAAQASQTFAEKKMQKQLARMMEDPMGKGFTTAMTDQCFRSQNSARVANQIRYVLQQYGVPHYLSPLKRFGLWLFKWLGPVFPWLFVPLTKAMVRRETASVILPGEPKALIKHIQQRFKEGVRVNLNHLGEAILGEEEAKNRLQIYLDDLSNPEIEYISVKISTIYSQISMLAWEESLAILIDRLKLLYRTARDHLYTRHDGTKVSKFVNLDMEEYRDLHLTVEAFCKVLDDPEFFNYSAGIVLQSYIPDSYPIQRELTTWARKRIAAGGAPIKIRIVKGANLAMEQVEASIRCWPQAPYLVKSDVDSNFKRMITYGSDPQNAAASHLGIGSHNLFDIAYTMLLRAENQIEKYVTFEMLEGMADHIRRIVQILSGDILLYCPAATKEEFQNAVAYLIRRLDENTAPENFLRQLFGLKPGTKRWKVQSEIFARACRTVHSVAAGPRRNQNRWYEPMKPTLNHPFTNEADTDWSLPHNRKWGEAILQRWSNLKQDPIPLVIAGERIITDSKATGEDPSYPGRTLYQYSLANTDDIEKALQTATKAQEFWSKTSVEERSALLAEIAHGLRKHRGDLIGAMVADTGKTLAEGDVEVSEAIDFAEYYRHSVAEWHAFKDIKWEPKGIVLVAPPWNFPCSIPAGGILAALAAGNSVIFKPPPESVLVGWELVQIFWEAGISKDVLQFITCEDEPVGSQLVQDKRVSTVVLTGATSTAKLLLRLRPGLDLVAETGGKNAIIVSNMSDRDLAIKDIVHSAFGHAGQKCSACSLAICLAEVYDDLHFRKQLRDAAASLRVGSPWNPMTKVNPLIRLPNPTLKRGLTELDEGEEWLLEPKKDPLNPQLWSPGIKLGVKPGSFTHQNELFGPVLGIIRAKDLEEAIEIANGNQYGLTSGIHSLDQREQDYWQDRIEAGNCYINRGITGAIVQRQPFGGCKESSFGPGAKAGGPNYVTQLMRPTQQEMPTESLTPKFVEALFKVANTLHFSEEQQKIFEISLGNYQYYFEYYFRLKHDPSGLLGQENLLSYVPHPKVLYRIQHNDSLLDILRVIGAAVICGTSLEVSGTAEQLKQISSLKLPNVRFVEEDEVTLIERIGKGKIKRIRLLQKPNAGLELALSQAGINVDVAPVLANGRVELLHFLREVSTSIDYHRYGNISMRFDE